MNSPGCKRTRIALISALFRTGPHGLIKGSSDEEEEVEEDTTASKLYCHVKSTRFPVKWDPKENTNGGARISSIVVDSLVLSLPFSKVVEAVGLIFFLRVCPPKPRFTSGGS